MILAGSSIVLCSEKAAQAIYDQALVFASTPGIVSAELVYYKQMADTALAGGAKKPAGVPLKKYEKYFGKDTLGKDAVKGDGEKRSEALDKTLNEMAQQKSSIDKLAVIFAKDNVGAKALKEVQDNPGESKLKDGKEFVAKAAAIMSEASKK